MTTYDPPPWEQLTPPTQLAKKPGLRVDLDRCIGCHACSVACKTEHSEKLGDFRMRVRWIPRPDRPSLAFIPVFDATKCDMGRNRRNVGLTPACAAACPTGAIIFGDLENPTDPVAASIASGQATPISDLATLHPNAFYTGNEAWMANALGRGAALSPDDPDITYEQKERGE